MIQECDQSSTKNNCKCSGAIRYIQKDCKKTVKKAF